MVLSLHILEVLYRKFVAPHHGPDIINGISLMSAVIPWVCGKERSKLFNTNIQEPWELERVQQR